MQANKLFKKRIGKVYKPVNRYFARNFLRRNKDLFSLVKPVYIDKDRFNYCTKEEVEDFFGKLKELFEIYNFEEGYIFNFDETFLSIKENKSKVIIEKDLKEQRVKARNNLNEHITFGLTVCADGSFLPPLVILPIKNYENYKNIFDKGTMFKYSDSGWINQKIFEEYLKEHFIPFVENKRGSSNSPVLLILDGHSSRSVPEALELCFLNNIHILSIPAHSSHLLQPLDLISFSTFKKAFYRKLDQTRVKDSLRKQEKRYKYLSIANSALWSAMEPKLIKKGFEKGGILPLNVEKPLSSELFIKYHKDSDNRSVKRETFSNKVLTDIFFIQTLGFELSNLH